MSFDMRTENGQAPAAAATAAPAMHAEYAPKTATRVRVFSPAGIVDGDYHHLPGVRLSDSLRNAVVGEKYMLLTDVEIRTTDGGELDSSLRTAPFILINTAHASMVIPFEDQ